MFESEAILGRASKDAQLSKARGGALRPVAQRDSIEFQPPSSTFHHLRPSL